MTPTFFAPPNPADVQPPPTLQRRRRGLHRVAAWTSIVSLGFAMGAVAKLTFRAEASARSTVAATVSTGTAEDAREQILEILNERYFVSIDADRLATTAIADLPTAIDDKYTHFMTAEEYDRYMSDETADTVGIGIDVVADPKGLAITRVFPNSPAALGWLLPGDVITAIDGRELAGQTVREGLAVLKGDAGTQATIAVERRDATLVATVVRRPAREWMVDAELRNVAGRSIGYIALMDFSLGAADLVRTATEHLIAAGAEAIVLDLRGNPGGWAKEAVGVAAVFLADGSSVLVERSVHFDETTYRTHDAPVDTTMPMAVLVDHDSASSAEIVAGALRDQGRAVLVGATTYGKGRIQDVEVLRTGGAFKFTIAEYLTPSGFALDRVGLTPDLSVTGSPAADADETFARAVTRITG